MDYKEMTSDQISTKIDEYTKEISTVDEWLFKLKEEKYNIKKKIAELEQKTSDTNFEITRVVQRKKKLLSDKELATSAFWKCKNGY